MDDLRLVYITAADADQALRIGRALVDERLAACANILPGMRSIYRWEGAVDEASEAVLIVKTRAAQVEAITVRVRALHSYLLPCVVAIPLLGGDPEYLAWLARESG